MPPAHDDVAGACAAFGLPDFPYRRFAAFAPPDRAAAAPEIPPAAPPLPEAPPPVPPASADLARGAAPQIDAVLPPLPRTPPSGWVLPVPFGSLAARIAARRPAAPLRLTWASAPSAAPQAAEQEVVEEAGTGSMFRRL